MTKRSTRRLSEVARHVVIPSGIVSTGWPAVEAKCREFGDEFDEWQRGAGQLILGKRDDGSYAATIGGVTLSIPRQVAKTFLVGRIVFALCVIFPGLKVIWTAHRTRTASNTFKALQGYAKRPDVAPHIRDIRRTNGEQEIAFTNGSIIMFGARETGFGRGFDEVDIEVFDEAQILTERALEDMVAATNQSRHPHGALLFFMGTPPRPVDPGEAFTERRKEALAFKDGLADFGAPVVGEDQLYIECSADYGCDLDDKGQWGKANPSYPHRTPLRSMLRLRKNLTSDDSWRREGLGVWDLLDAGHIVDPSAWASLHDVEGDRPDPVVFGLSSSPDRKWTTLGLAGRRADGHAFLQPVQSGRGTEWVPERVEALVDRWGRITVAIPGDDQAASLKDQIASRKVTVKTLTAREMSQACAMFVRGVEEETIRHSGAQQLAVSLGVARKRNVGRDGWVFAGTETSDVAPLNAVVAPLYVLETSPQKRRSGVVYV